ncbi:MAG: hypothetical protein K8T89_27075 [Planctomycetes bacterium]|nr:hypothetical protein [Planctomycetota bacterium]
MYYTVDWSKWDKPDEKGRQIVFVIHNTPNGDFQHVIKVQKDTVTTVSSQQDKDGNKSVVLFEVPAKLNSIPKRLKIASVKWNATIVPSGPPAVKK